MSAAAPLVAERAVFGTAERAAGPLELRVEPDATVWLSAPSPGLKRLLVRGLVGLEPLRSGRVELLGETLDAERPVDALALRARAGLVPSEGSLLQNLDLAANLELLARYHLGLEGAALTRRIEDVCALLELPARAALAETRVAAAEPHLRQRVAIGRALAVAPPLVILDEPAWGIDADHADDFWRIMARLHATSGLALLVASAFPPRRFVTDLQPLAVGWATELEAP